MRASTMTVLQNYSWPGNVRDLRNVIERHIDHQRGICIRSRGAKVLRKKRREIMSVACLSAPGGGYAARVLQQKYRN